jgi:hypothetical protein
MANNGKSNTLCAKRRRIKVNSSGATPKLNLMEIRQEQQNYKMVTADKRYNSHSLITANQILQKK